MGLFVGDSEPSKIFVGDTPISKVFLGDTQVRPKTWKPGANTLGYYTFDDQNANQITDFSGKGNNLTGNTMPSYILVSGSNYAGNYANVNSSNTPYTIIGNINNGITVVMRVKATATNSRYVSFIGRNSSKIDYFQSSIIRGYNSGQFEYYEDKSGENTQRTTIKSGVSTNAWYLIGYTRDSSNSVKTYVNGEIGGTLNGFTETASEYLYLGGSNLGDRFKGQIGECVVENKSRTADEITNYYNLTKGNYGL